MMWNDMERRMSKALNTRLLSVDLVPQSSTLDLQLQQPHGPHPAKVAQQQSQGGARTDGWAVSHTTPTAVARMGAKLVCRFGLKPAVWMSRCGACSSR